MGCLWFFGFTLLLSKRDCEALAMQMGKLSFTTEDEKKLTRQIFANAIEPLSEDDKQLPQIQHLLPLLQKVIQFMLLLLLLRFFFLS